MDINVSPSPTVTDLCILMESYGSDKGGANNPRHYYTKYYYNLFSQVRYEPLRIFEMGIGTTNPNYRYNMGPTGKPGASLKCWKEFFPNSHIFGADIDTSILFSDTRIDTFFCDQGRQDSITDMWNNPKLAENVDIIIDDGCHEPFYNILLFETSFYKLNKGGVYIIEDTTRIQEEYWLNKLQIWKTQYPDSQFNYIKIENLLYGDDILIVIRK